MSRTILIATCAFLVVVCFSPAEGGNCQSRCANRCGIMHKRQQSSYWDCTKRCAQLATTCEVCYGPRKCIECMTGYRLTNNRYCVYDLCVINNGGCSALEDCSYATGSVVCTCKAGYQKIGTTCTDINECGTNNGGCPLASSTCTNTAGSFKCACNQGYTGDGKTCSDINECLANNGGCSEYATCSNGGGSFTCTCKAGYSGTGFTCTDDNECDLETDTCDSNADCQNTIGSYTCSCNPGYYGDGQTCKAFPRSCWDIKNVPTVPISDPPSGEYSIWVPRLVQNITVYCEMGLGTGGYTFLNPFYIPSLIDDDIQAMIGSRSRAEILVRMRKKDGSQPFAKITQLTRYVSKNLLISLSTHPGYEPTKNEDSAIIGAPYLYIGFLSSVDAGNIPTNNPQGFVVNGVDVTFTACVSATGLYRYNYFALYPNFHDRQPTNYLFSTNNYAIVTNFANNMKAVNSRRVMPEEYFMFFEMHFGGCGGFSQTDGRADVLNNNYLSASVGFL